MQVCDKVPGDQDRGCWQTRRLPQPGWQSAQMVKQRRNGRVVSITWKELHCLSKWTVVESQSIFLFLLS